MAICSRAQQIRPAASDKIYHEMAGLGNLVNVLYVAAHPDDENTRLLAWLVNDRHIRTAYLSLTRGDGGQNILGPEQGDALGLIRTHELLEARKIDGAEQYFTRAIDFGFSKSYQETFKHWLKDTLIADAALVIREFRPDVIICRFPPDTMAGHGHHAASAIIGAAAAKAAADAGAYRGELGGLAPWHAKRVLFNAYRFGSFSTVKEDMFKMPVGDYQPLSGYGTGELAGLSRSVHKSQGAGTPSVPGTQLEYFKLVDGEPFNNSIFDGIDTTWDRLGRGDIGKKVNLLLHDYNFLHPENSLAALIELRSLIATVTDEYWRVQKLKEVDKLRLDCAGFMTELYCDKTSAAPGDTLAFTLHYVARSGLPVKLQSLKWKGYSDKNYDELGIRTTNDSLGSLNLKIGIPPNTPLTQPYWLAQAPDGAIYKVNDRADIGMPETPNALTATLTLQIGDLPLTVAVPLSSKRLDPLKGDVVEPLRIMPSATLTFSSDLLIADAAGVASGQVTIHANREIKAASFLLQAENGVTLQIIRGIDLSSGADTLVQLSIDSKKCMAPGINHARLSAGIVLADGSRCSATPHLIQYSHLPTLQYFSEPSITVIKPDWKCTAKRIGYIEGAGDHVAAVLAQTGIEVDVLKPTDLTNPAHLKKYDAIITGIRAFNVEKHMATWIKVLLKYAENGGTLVVQYNTLQDPVTKKYGPYPITLSGKRVTEEDATITFTSPEHRLLNYPNKITDGDFKDWVQERGLYFASAWDDHYQTLFSMHDEGEQPLSGSTLFAKVGKGNYIYTSLSFSRQLPAGNIGAIKLFMNMLSVGK